MTDFDDTTGKEPRYALDPREIWVHSPGPRQKRPFDQYFDKNSFSDLPSFRGHRNPHGLFDCFDSCKLRRYGREGFLRRANLMTHLRACHEQDVPREGYLSLDTSPFPSTNETGRGRRQMPMERDEMRLEVELPIVIEKKSARLKEERPIFLKPRSKQLLSMAVSLGNSVLTRTICQVIATDFMVHGTEEQKLRLSIRNIGGTKQIGAKKQVGQGGNSTETTLGASYNKSIPCKRPLGDSESNKGAPDYSNEDESKAQPKLKRRLTKQEPPRLYICPFYRKDPENLEFRTGGCFVKCRTQGIKTDKLKEHIRRIHTKPAQCLKCGRRGDIGEIRDHRRDVECREKIAITKVDNQTLLKDQEITNQKRITWHKLFVLLFPDHCPEPPMGAEYFDYEFPPSLQNIELNKDAHVENTDVLEDSGCQDMAKGTFELPPPFEKIGQNLAAQLERRTILESFLRWWSSEYPTIIASNVNLTSGSRAETVGAAILMAMISSHPFQTSSSNTSTQPPTAPDHALQPSINSGAAPITAFTRPDPNVATLNITSISNLTPNLLEDLPPNLRQVRSGGNNTVAVPERAIDITDSLERFLNGSLADWDFYVDNALFDEITL